MSRRASTSGPQCPAAKSVRGVGAGAPRALEKVRRRLLRGGTRDSRAYRATVWFRLYSRRQAERARRRIPDFERFVLQRLHDVVLHGDVRRICVQRRQIVLRRIAVHVRAPDDVKVVHAPVVHSLGAIRVPLAGVQIVTRLRDKFHLCAAVFEINLNLCHLEVHAPVIDPAHDPSNRGFALGETRVLLHTRPEVRIHADVPIV